MPGRAPHRDDQLFQLPPELREGLEKARAEAARGLTVPEDQVDAWIDSWDTPDERTTPQVARQAGAAAE